MGFFNDHVESSFKDQVDEDFVSGAGHTINIISCFMSLLWAYLFEKYGFKVTYTLILSLVGTISILCPLIVLTWSPLPNASPSMKVFKNIVYLISHIIMGLC